MYNFIKELGKIDVGYFPDSSPGDRLSFRSYIKSVTEDFILIEFLFKEGNEYFIREGEWIKVHIKDPSGIYAGDSQILGRENESELPGIKISFPQNIEFIQNREYVRVPMKLNIELVLLVDENGTDVKLYNEKTVDVSGSGISFVSNYLIDKHYKATGFLTLPGSPESPIEISLKHIYSRPFFGQSKKRYKNAFTYIEIEEKDREKLLREILMFQLEMRKKGFE